MSDGNKIVKYCKNCGKEMLLYPSEARKFTYCSLACRTAAKTVGTECKYCKKPMVVTKSKYDRNKNGVYCSHECSELDSKTGVWSVCDYCGKPKYRIKSNHYGLTFCNEVCAKEYRIQNQKLDIKICEQCGSEYRVRSSRCGKTRFCSVPCKNLWQSINNVGEANHKYSSVKMGCDYCGREISVPKHRLSSQNAHFCSYDCRDKFYQIIENRTGKQRARDKTICFDAIKGLRPKRSGPHNTVISLLKSANINFVVEYNIKYYLIDIFLCDYNLSVEVNGDFWHCSPKRYDRISYQQQIDSIRRDRSKRTYVRRYLGHEILWLWEKDIVDDPLLCIELIKAYIKNNGNLENYHSFNYTLGDENQCILNAELIVPFQSMSRQEIASHTSIKPTGIQTQSSAS